MRGALGSGARQGRAAVARKQRAAGARAGTAWARRGARLGAWCARGTAGLGVAWALDGCAGWASFGALCTWLSSGSVFGPGSTRYFPESPMNTVHGKINFRKKKYLLNSNKNQIKSNKF